MKKIKTAIVGYGNLGKDIYEAIISSPDMEIAGVVIRDVTTAKAKGVPAELKVTSNIADLGAVDVAFLCIPSREVLAEAGKILSLGINTVDSYDMHGDLYDVQQKLDAVAKQSGAVAIIGTGFDPGIDSVVRCLFEAAAPRGITYTNYGPGMSLGHTVAVKAIPGVAKALSMTIPLGTSIHRRMVYVELSPGANADDVTAAIKQDAYFINDETHVKFVPDVDVLIDKGHGVNLVRKGASGAADNQLLEFNMKINNPALTTQMMVATGRASVKQKPGCYTIVEIPPVDLLPGGREEVIRRLV